MGIPKFFRFISERYPCIQEKITDQSVLDYDYLYLDLNGIIHACSHAEDHIRLRDLSQREIFENIFKYVDMLFDLIRPKKALFLAVDGVAPRAKLNQQRGRRFQAAKDRERFQENFLTQSIQQRFDSNCITPGTKFMISLQKYLNFYIISRVSNCPLWQRCQIVLSGHEVPGEGEHKIIEFVRYAKALPTYDLNSKHCLYGLDADLLILGLCTHEQNFSILREDVLFGRKSHRIPHPEEITFSLTHLSMLKEYLEMEFNALNGNLLFTYSLNSIADDWVLLGFIVGNDFIPNLPDFHITKGALPVLYDTYLKVLPTLDGYLNENGFLNLSRFNVFMRELGRREKEMFIRTAKRFQNVGVQHTDEEYLRRRISELKRMLGDNYAIKPNETEDEYWARLFDKYKAMYYTTKLKIPEVTEEFLKTQAVTYVRGLQWVLSYYYHGCHAWSWYYPYHYAPFASDIINFEDADMAFDTGKPFLPYEQLLAVLPPGSNNLLPSAYRNLMTSELLSEYYPNDFVVDLNGKQHDWEAVVLLPLLDEDVLFFAMAPYNHLLDEKEKMHNVHGPILFYNYSSRDFGFFRGPSCYPPIGETHAQISEMRREEMISNVIKFRAVGKYSRLQRRFSEFPTLKHKIFNINKMWGAVKIFNCVSKNESIILNLIGTERLRKCTRLKRALEGRTVFINWPYLHEAKILRIVDTKNLKCNEGEDLNLKQDMIKNGGFNFDLLTYSYDHYKEERGVDIGKVEFVAFVNRKIGIREVYRSKGIFRPVKVWSKKVECVPLQTILSKPKNIITSHMRDHMIKQLIPPKSVVFLLNYRYYGCKGEIKHYGLVKEELPVEVEMISETDINRDELILRSQCEDYLSATEISRKIHVNQKVIGKLAGSILIEIPPEESLSHKKLVVNIGLVLKFSKANEIVPGYARKENNIWKYSTKAVDIIKEYATKYPRVINYLALRNVDVPIYRKSDIFPGNQGYKDIMSIVHWIKNLECSTIPRVACESEILEDIAVQMLESAIDNSRNIRYHELGSIKVKHLFASNLVTGNVAPDPEARHYLLDRVVCVVPHHVVPLGLRGYIIGIIKSGEREDMYDVLYDELFPIEKTLNSDLTRVYRMSKLAFINVSHGKRNGYNEYSEVNRVAVNRLNSVPRQYPHRIGGTSRPRRACRNFNRGSAPRQWNVHACMALWDALQNARARFDDMFFNRILRLVMGGRSGYIEDNVRNSDNTWDEDVWDENAWDKNAWDKNAWVENTWDEDVSDEDEWDENAWGDDTWAQILESEAKTESMEMKDKKQSLQKSQPKSEERSYWKWINYFKRKPNTESFKLKNEMNYESNTADDGVNSISSLIMEDRLGASYYADRPVTPEFIPPVKCSVIPSLFTKTK